MKQAKLEKLFEEHKTNEFSWQGVCHDCKKDVEVLATLSENGIEIIDGAVYEPEGADKIFLKCSDCYEKDSVLRNFRVTEVFSRVVGYMRPVSSWNAAKQEEFHERKNYKALEPVADF